MLSVALLLACTAGVAPETGDAIPDDSAIPSDTGRSDTGDTGTDDCERQPWFADVDGDGYGSADAVVQACETPTDHVAVAGDCDDLDPEVHPDAVEICDMADNDCDGVTDPPGSPGGIEAFPDHDGDGAARAGAGEVLCLIPPGWRLTPGEDCDDDTVSVGPAVPERCNDYDDDCDGVVDEDGICEESWCGVPRSFAPGGYPYFVLPPEDWDGVTPLSVVVVLPPKSIGAGRWVCTPGRSEPIHAAGHLMVTVAAPTEELWNSWDVAPYSDHDDVAGILGVVDEVSAAYPVRSDAVYLLGWSSGAAAAWELACKDQTSRFRAHAAWGGGLLEPVPTCTAPPVRLRSYHATGDNQWRIGGGPWGATGAIQVSVDEAGAVLHAQNQCGGSEVVDDGWASCEVGTACAADSAAEMCIYEGGHPLPEDWIARSMDWFEEVAP